MEITTQQAFNLNTAINLLYADKAVINKYLGYRLVVLSEKIAPTIEALKENWKDATPEERERILNEKVDLGKTDPINLSDLPDEVTIDVINNFKKSGLLKE